MNGRWTWFSPRLLMIACTLGVVLGVTMAGGTGMAMAAFRNSDSASNTVSTKRIFPGQRTVASWDLRDASGGSGEVNQSDPLAFASDSLILASGAKPTAFNTTAFADIDFMSSLPGGLAVSGMTANVRFASSAAGETSCIYIQARRASTNSTLATYGSAASPSACVTGTTQTTFALTMPVVDTSDLANDFEFRMYMRNSGGHYFNFDLITVSGNTSFGSFTLRRTVAADETGANNWTLWAKDSDVDVTASKWSSTASTSRYLGASFNANVPSAATVSSAKLTHTWSDSTGSSACYYVEIYNGTTLLATKGSSSNGYCNNSSSLATDSINVPEINTPAKANNVSIKMYVWTPGGSRSTRHDELTMSVNYSLT